MTVFAVAGKTDLYERAEVPVLRTRVCVSIVWHD